MSSSAINQIISKNIDLYNVLKVTPKATVKEIKVSYFKLVKELHPDTYQHADLSDTKRQAKLEQFRSVTEAYDILSDPALKRQYDSLSGSLNNGKRYNADFYDRVRKNHFYKQRVYRPQAPPEWNGFTYDHQKHYEYHYGDGFFHDALNEARKRHREQGYRSPLGRGFSFSADQEEFNPYAKKTPQGPPKVEFVYQEGDLKGSTGSYSQYTSRKQRIVKDIHERRYNRQQAEALKEEVRRKQQKRYNATFAPKDSDSCVIL